MSFLSEFKNFIFILNIFYSFFLFFFLVDFNLFYSINESFIGFFINYFNYFTNFYLVLILLFLCSIKNVIYSFINGNFNNFNSETNSIYLNILFYSYIKDVLLITFNFYISYLLFFINKLTKSNVLLLFFINKVFRFINPISWYPIFKRHSIFGYYRIARQNWVELKTEEVNFLKY